LRIADDPKQVLAFGTCRDLSATGVGVTCDRRYPPGTLMDIALHLPEASLYGRAVVRFCRELDEDLDDEYIMGFEFIFED
jgi:hypothetical protein